MNLESLLNWERFMWEIAGGDDSVDIVAFSRLTDEIMRDCDLAHVGIDPQPLRRYSYAAASPFLTIDERFEDAWSTIERLIELTEASIKQDKSDDDSALRQTDYDYLRVIEQLRSDGEIPTRRRIANVMGVQVDTGNFLRTLSRLTNQKWIVSGGIGRSSTGYALSDKGREAVERRNTAH